MITARYDLEHVNEALQAMASYQVVKAVIDLD
jgi:Zn-dependent alcohol dehydrogenase